MTDEKDARLTRQLIREELDASNSYEEKAQATSDPEAAKVYRDISREEKVHAGELQALLDREDPESTEAMKEGIEETGLEGSFKDIFDRKREDYIHKSMFGVHIEKAGKMDNDRAIRNALQRERDTETATGTGENKGKPQNTGFMSRKDLTERLGFDPLVMTIGDLFLKGPAPENETPRGQDNKAVPNDALTSAARWNTQDRDKLYGALMGVKDIGPHRALVDEFMAIMNKDRKGRPHAKNPTGEWINSIDELDKVLKGKPRGALSPEEALAQTMERQRTGEEGDGEPSTLKNRELNRPGLHRPNMGTKAPIRREQVLDYDIIFEPDKISKEEVEAYLKRSGDRAVKDPIAPNSAKRPWLTWKYFGNHLLQATPIVVPARDKYGKKIYRVKRVPVMKEVEDPVKGKIYVPTGEFTNKTVEEVEFIMNYRISKGGKDIQFEQGPYEFKTRWDPKAYNPATKEFSGAFLPVSITTPDKRVIYDIASVGHTSRDPWDIFEEDVAKRSLMNGIEEYIRNPEFREKLSKIDLPKDYAKTTAYADEVAEMVKGEEGGQMLAKLQAALPPGVTLNKVIAQLSRHYDGINQDIQAQKQAMASDKSMLDMAVRMAAEEDVRDRLNAWIAARNIKGMDGSDVSADTLENYLDRNTGTIHLLKNGKEYLLPQQNLSAWIDHAQEFCERAVRLERLDIVRKEEAEQEALDERTNAEDAEIEKYLYDQFRKRYEAETGKDVTQTKNAEEELRQQANIAANEILYGDGTLAQQILQDSKILDPDTDIREYMLNKAGFNWDVVEYNRNLKERLADRALAEEVATLADPKYHERVKTDLNTVRAKQKGGILGLLATRLAEKDAEKQRVSNLQNSLASALQDFLTRSKGIYGNKVGLYRNDGSLMFNADEILGTKVGQNSGKKVKEYLNERYAEDIKNGRGPKTDDAEGWNQFYTEKLKEHIPNTLIDAIDNVRTGLTSSDEADRQKFEEYLRKKLSKKLGSNTVNEFLERMSAPKMDMRSILNDIQTGANDGHTLLKILMDANNLTLVAGSKDRRGVLGKETTGFDYKEGQKELTGMFVAALQGTDSGAEFDALREVARQYTLDLIDGKVSDPDMSSADIKRMKAARSEVMRVFDAVQKREVYEYFERAAMEHHNIPRAPGKPRRGTKNFDTRMKKWEAKMQQHEAAVKANEEVIKKEIKESLADPAKVLEAKQILYGVVKFKTLSAVSKDHRARRVLSFALGHDDKVMSTTGFKPFMDQALATDEIDFLEQQEKNKRLTPEEEYQQRIAKYKGEGMSDAQALIASFKDMGYSDRQARLEAARYLELRMKDRDDSGELSPVYRDLYANTGWGVGDINIEGALETHDLDESAYRKLVMSAMADYFKKYIEDARQKNPNAEIVQEFDNADKATRSKMLGDFYTKLGLMAPLESDPSRSKVVWDKFFDSKDHFATELMNNFISKNLSLRDAESLGLPMKDVQMGALKNYNTQIDRLIRDRMINTLAKKYSGEKGEYEGRTQMAKIQAANQINMAFPHTIGRDDIGPGNEEFFAKLQKYGVSPEDVRGIQIQAMKGSNSALYSDFINPYFTNSGRAEDDSRDTDELDLFESLSRGIPVQQNPALTQAWNDYYSKGGTLSYNQAAEIRRKIEDYLRNQITGKREAQKAHTQELRDFLATQGAPLENLEAVKGEKGQLMSDYENESALKEHYNAHIARTNRLMEALGYGPVNIKAEHAEFPSYNEFAEDRENTGVSAMMGSDGHLIFPQSFDHHSGRYNQLVYEALQTYAQKYDGNLDYIMRGWEEIDPDKFKEELSDSAMRRMMYMTKTGELPPDSIQNDTERIARAVYTSLIHNPDTTLNFDDEEARRAMWNARYKVIEPTIPNTRATSPELEAKRQQMAAYNEEQARREEFKNVNKVSNTAAEEFDEAVRGMNENKSQEGEGPQDSDKVTPRTPDSLEEVKVPNYLGDTSTMVATAEDKPMVEIDDSQKMTVGHGAKVKNLPQHKNYLNGTNKDMGADFIPGETPTLTTSESEIKEVGSSTSSDIEKKTQSAFDTPFADILSSKRTQAIRKNETGTVISSEPVSESMTEQTDAPQEQNTIETGGFAELMKSKMASTHVMEEPSEEREDWIPMRNGYRRVTIGSGKDCVHSMMRNPPRSANAPGTRTRKV